MKESHDALKEKLKFEYTKEIKKHLSNNIGVLCKILKKILKESK